MPEYPFRDEETGETVRVLASMDEAVPIGETVEIEGRRLTRILSESPQVAAPADVHMTCHSLPKRHPGADSYDRAGRPQFSSKRTLDNFCAKYNYEHKGLD